MISAGKTYFYSPKYHKSFYFSIFGTDKILLNIKQILRFRSGFDCLRYVDVHFITIKISIEWSTTAFVKSDCVPLLNVRPERKTIHYYGTELHFPTTLSLSFFSFSYLNAMIEILCSDGCLLNNKISPF